jgi:hypothetical protein
LGKYINKEVCAQCGGKCCKSMGCQFSPKDFKDLTFEGLKKEIDKGYISIDWWDGNPFEDDRDIRKGYYLRIRNLNKSKTGKAPIVDASWGGVCCLLTDKGCPFTFEQRPHGAKMLMPGDTVDEGCTEGYSKQHCARDWYEYDDILSQLEDYYC